MGATAWDKRGKGKGKGKGGKYKEAKADVDPKEQSQLVKPQVSYASVLRGGLEETPAQEPEVVPEGAQPAAASAPNESEVDSTGSDCAPTSVASCETMTSLSLGVSPSPPPLSEASQLKTHDPYASHIHPHELEAACDHDSPTGAPFGPSAPTGSYTKSGPPAPTPSAPLPPYTIGYPTPDPFQAPQQPPTYTSHVNLNYSTPPPQQPMGYGVHNRCLEGGCPPVQPQDRQPPPQGWNGYPQAQPQPAQPAYPEYHQPSAQPSQYSPYGQFGAPPPAPSGGEYPSCPPPTNPGAIGGPPTPSGMGPGSQGTGIDSPPGLEGEWHGGSDPYYDPQGYYGQGYDEVGLQYDAVAPLAPVGQTHPCLRLFECCMYLDHCRLQDLPREWCLKCLKGWGHADCDGEDVPSEYKGWAKRFI